MSWQSQGQPGPAHPHGTVQQAQGHSIPAHTQQPQQPQSSTSSSLSMIGLASFSVDRRYFPLG